MPGFSLHDQVQEEGPVTGADLIWLARGLAEGVASVHAAGVLHRDVKPSNVLMEGRTPILIDFGLARVADDPRLTHTGWLLGTPGYLPPEILYGEDATPASDVHSWAATVAYAGTGRSPFGTGPVDGDHGPRPPRRPRPRRAARRAAQRRGRRRSTPSRPPAQARPPPRAGSNPDAEAPTPSPRGAAGGARGPVHDAAGHRRPGRRGAGRAAAADPRGAGGPGTWVLPDHPDQPNPAYLPQHGWVGPPVAPRAPGPERARRASLLVATGVAVAAAITAYPYLATALVLALVWLLRSGSLTAQATGDRQRLRGRARWWDVVVAPLSRPWSTSSARSPARSCWCSGPLALPWPAALLCYAASATVEITLFVSGVLSSPLSTSDPVAPGCRRPLSRLVNPLARGTRTWLVAMLVAIVAAIGLGLVAETGVGWDPAKGQPGADLRLPGG